MESTVQLLQELLSIPAVRAGGIFVGALIAALLINLLLRVLLGRLTHRTATELDDRLVRLLRTPVFITVVLTGAKSAIAVLGPAPGLMALLHSVIQSILVVVWVQAGLRVSSTLLAALGGLAGRLSWLDERTIPLFDNLAKIVLFGGAVYGLLLAWNLDVKPWLASAGILGVALGFAAKDTLANLFGGMSVIIDAPYKIGDFINLGSGERGKVTKIGLRSTRLLTRDDIEITLPNAQIANSTIVNESGGPSEKFRVEIRAGVAYGSDVDHVREVLFGAASEVELASTDPTPRVRFLEMGDSALIFRVMCWVDEPVLRGACVDALNTKVYKRLREAGIEIPFPQRELHLRQPFAVETS